jgi:hypothetical protein
MLPTYASVCNKIVAGAGMPDKYGLRDIWETPYYNVTRFLEVPDNQSEWVAVMCTCPSIHQDAFVPAFLQPPASAYTITSANLYKAKAVMAFPANSQFCPAAH